MSLRWLRGYRSIENVGSGGPSPPSGPAGGDLSGTYPNPDVVAIHETGGPTQLAIGAIADGQFAKRVGATLVGATLPAISPSNRDMVASVTALDNDLATATSLANTLATNAWLIVFVNGISYKIGNGTKVAVPCYFSSDGGVTARAIGNLTSGDLLYWNGSVSGFQLDAADRIDFVYEA